MADTAYRDDTPTPYSAIEGQNPQSSPQQLEDPGLQSTHLYGDDILNGKEVAHSDDKEVAHAEGLEPTRDDFKEFSKPAEDIEKDPTIAGWKQRKLCGIPLLLLVAIIVLLVIGTVLGARRLMYITPPHSAVRLPPRHIGISFGIWGLKDRRQSEAWAFIQQTLPAST